MVSSRGLRFTAKVFAPFYSDKQDYSERKLRFLWETGDRNGKYRNPEDSGRNMQPSKQVSTPSWIFAFMPNSWIGDCRAKLLASHDTFSGFNDWSLGYSLGKTTGKPPGCPIPQDGEEACSHDHLDVQGEEHHCMVVYHCHHCGNCNNSDPYSNQTVYFVSNLLFPC